MIFTKEGEDDTYVDIDLDKWNAVLLPLLKIGNNYYRFEDKSNTQIHTISKSLVMPLLLYSIIEMKKLFKDTLVEEKITADLEVLSRVMIERDSCDFITLSYPHAKFISDYEDDVKAWLPLVVRRYVQPNHKRLKDVLCATI